MCFLPSPVKYETEELDKGSLEVGSSIEAGAGDTVLRTANGKRSGWGYLHDRKREQLGGSAKHRASVPDAGSTHFPLGPIL